MGEFDYQRFTGPQEMARGLHELEGLVRGIALDRQLNAAEVSALQSWCAERAGAARTSPFDELIPLVTAALADGTLDDEERADILWVCERIRTPNAYFASATSDMQRLHGLLAGIGADGVVNEQELRGLRSWIDDAEGLRGTWPYDEIDTLVMTTLADGRIDEDEHARLLAYCREFQLGATNLAVEGVIGRDFALSGVCATCPEIEFPGRRFCFTGVSACGQRSVVEVAVERLGGLPIQRVRRDLDYLIVGASHSRAWAFSCYGRKVEAAVALRRQGLRLAIVHESDLWDAAADLGVEPPRVGDGG